MNILTETAEQYSRLGLSVIPVDNNKKSTIYWKKYQHTRLQGPYIRKIFHDPLVAGIALVCGESSKNLQGIDIDARNDLTGSLFRNFTELAEDRQPGLFQQLVQAATRNNGFHLYYRCDEIGSNVALARRPCTTEEKIAEPNEKLKILIETRAQGGYIIVPPTPGYEFIHKDFQTISTITPSQKNSLLSIARSFDEYREPIPILHNPQAIYTGATSPFLDFDNQGDATFLNLIELLQRHGWIVVQYGPPKTYFRRPGKTLHKTSGDYHHHLNLFAVFSSSTEFIPMKGYKPHAVYAILECGGNFKLAARKLVELGYGRPYRLIS